MEETILYLSLSFLFLIISLKLFFPSKHSTHTNLPPSPPSLPIIGHLHLLKPLTHRFYHTLSQKYGPIFSLRLGSRRLVVVSSSSVAEECFTTNDIMLANRREFISGKHLNYNNTTVTASSYGDHWRNLRRVAAVEIFSSSRLKAFEGIRRDEVKYLLLRLSRYSRRDFTKVKLKSLLAELMFNNTMRMVAGKRYYGDGVSDEAEAREFGEIITESFKSSRTTNPADFFPLLNWLCRGYERKVEKLGKRMDIFLQKLVDEHRSEMQENANTMIHHLLSLQESKPECYTDQIIKGFIASILFAGTDTSILTLEWAMSNLLNHPKILQKARAEIDNQIGQENLMEEQDVGKLYYLQSIIKETLRLYPPGPLLLPHMPSIDSTIGGYDAPRGTIVLVNAWAIHRDPNLWNDPTSFKPERFDQNDNNGESYKFMPFGFGRRACPGASLAQRVVGLTLGSLIQCFDWETVDGKAIDMTEGEGLTMPKAWPLEVRCKARPIVNKAFHKEMVEISV